MKLFHKFRRRLRQWWACRTKNCDYYRHYLAYGPAELTHIGFHSAEVLADIHFSNCRYNGPAMCPICLKWESRLRA